MVVWVGRDFVICIFFFSPTLGVESLMITRLLCGCVLPVEVFYRWVGCTFFLSTLNVLSI